MIIVVNIPFSGHASLFSYIETQDNTHVLTSRVFSIDELNLLPNVLAYYEDSNLKEYTTLVHHHYVEQEKIVADTILKVAPEGIYAPLPQHGALLNLLSTYAKDSTPSLVIPASADTLVYLLKADRLHHENIQVIVFTGEPKIVFWRSLELKEALSALNPEDLDSAVNHLKSIYLHPVGNIVSDLDSYYRRYIGDILYLKKYLDIKIVPYNEQGEHIIQTTFGYSDFKFSASDYYDTASTQLVNNRYIKPLLSDDSTLFLPASSYSASSTFPANIDSWYCVRIDAYVRREQCEQCINTAGESVSVINRRSPVECRKYPCAYECVYSKGRRKTVQESINDFNWELLP